MHIAAFTVNIVTNLIPVKAASCLACGEIYLIRLVCSVYFVRDQIDQTDQID